MLKVEKDWPNGRGDRSMQNYGMETCFIGTKNWCKLLSG